ncbi:hypothetical protein AB0F85_30390 [Nocardia fluminea]|uniref:hypothetical protein n=1 Tax=Nocardia fluminea TaxID=134984 RepID=UPI003403041C
MTGPHSEDSHDIVPHTDRGLTEAGDVGHRDYVMAKIVEAATRIDKIRAPLDWQRQVEMFGDQKLLHDMLMHGYQKLQGRTPETGWRNEHVQRTGAGLRRHDAAHVVERAGQTVVKSTAEFKAGSVSEADGLKQLDKERYLLSSGRTKERSEYIVRAERPPHPAVMREAQQLAKDYPGKFVVVELSESQFARAVEAGRPIVRALTMEKLGHLIEQIRESPELRTAPHALEKFAHEITLAKERGQPISLEVLVGSRDELANLLEADRRITQERDKIARDAAKLRLKEAQIVEQVQAQQREARHQALVAQLERVDREIVLSAVNMARAQVPTKAPVKQLELPGVDPEIARAMSGMAAHLVQQREGKAREALEREALAGLALPTAMHREVAELVLAQRREAPGQAITVEHVMVVEQTVREREAREQAKARESQAREEREREQRKLMARIVDAHNLALERAALEQGKPRGVDRLEDKAREERAPELANILRLDAKWLAERGIDPRVVDAIARGMARPDDKAHALVVEVGDGPRWVDEHSPEVALAKQIQMVDKGVDLNLVYVRQAMDRGMSAPAVARSREDLEQKRLELERERALQRELHPEVKSRAREAPGLSKGIGRGK